MVNPVVLGSGKSLFTSADLRIGVRLLEARPFGPATFCSATSRLGRT
jgi:hypothetical protein